MIQDLLIEFLSLSDNMRFGYKSSLGTAYQEWKKIIAAITQPVPEIFQEIYSRFAGTCKDVPNQKYIDFIPGYRLIHIRELEKEYYTLLHLIKADNIYLPQINVIVPLLADYSSCYVCYVKKWDDTEAIFAYSPGDGLVERHSSVEKFFETIISFYKEEVYFLDDKGFLDYDFEKEGLVGGKHNPDIVYWTN